MADQFLHGAEVVEIDNGTRAIRTPKSSVQFFCGTAPDADSAKVPLNEPVLIDSAATAAALGATGTLPDCFRAAHAQGYPLSVMVRVAEDADPATQIANVVGDAAAMTGVHAALGAGSVLGIEPRIFSAPGFTGARIDNAANPVGAAMKGLVEKARGTLIIDGPNTTEADAIAARADYGSSRVYMVDPAVKVFLDGQTVIRPASAYASALIAKRDHEKGAWWSPSNQIIAGITGPARPIPFGLSARDLEANRLNENEIATIVHSMGYRLWGNRTTSSDPNWAFINVRRMADLIYDAVERAFLWAMDRPLTAQLILDIQNSVDAYLRHLKALGAILGGRSYLDPELNTPTTLKAGKLYIDFDIEPPAPLEHLTFRAFRNGAYYEELTSNTLLAA